MVCGLCGGPYTVITSKGPNIRYGCPNYRFRDTCANKMTILRTRLERQLISALSTSLLDPRQEEERTREFVAQLKARIDLEEKLAQEAEMNLPALEKERYELNARGRRLSEAIAMTGHSPFLLEQLKGVDSRLAEIDDRLSSKPIAKLASFTDEQVREFLRKESSDFCEVLTGDPETAKREIRKRIKQLVLTPKPTPNGTVIEVAGDVELFQREDVVLNNSMDGTAQQYNLPRILITAVLAPRMHFAA